jgi:hypothetical protein
MVLCFGRIAVAQHAQHVSAASCWCCSAVKLQVALLDDAGELVEQPAAGKFFVSWKSGSKKGGWEGKPARMPPVQVPSTAAASCILQMQAMAGCCACMVSPVLRWLLSSTVAMALQVPTSVLDVGSHWVRFEGSNPPMLLEAAVEIHAVPAQPTRWHLR